MTDEYDARANEALILGKKLYAICRGRRTEAAGYGASYLLAILPATRQTRRRRSTRSWRSRSRCYRSGQGHQ